jgi:nucleoside-diphosphate-sugar epimerase
MEKTNATSFRLATVFGISPRMRLDLLVNNFTLRAVTDGFVIVFEGHFKRNYIHLIDVVQAFNLALENEKYFGGQIFNVGLSEANISKIQLCEKIREILPDFTFLEAALGKDPDQRNYVVSNAKIEALGFKPKVTLEEGIKELVNGLRIFNHKPFTNL